MTASLENKVALVTGAAGGLGRAIAAALRDAGARLALADLDADGLASAAQRLGSAETFAVDLTDDDRSSDLPARVHERLGSIDIVVNNAGARPITSLLETSPEQWHSTLGVNLTAPFLICRSAIPYMLEQGRGKIVNIASIAGLTGFTNRSAYCSAKAGLVMLTRAIAMEFGGRGIWCNAIAPGFVETPMTASYFQTPRMLDSIKACAPMQRWGQPPEIAEPVAFLAGSGSDYINGATLPVDGGWTAGKDF
ncbi:SDR family NAD(P)-dependent oxidoreductase [Amycolatopsis sp. Poz14]|uniref:SDR family NAD(P)-dependent oxidoreductase n=1 Tax=Amycolatopsis sp. Poz14 TaxID=1447705 RepID=UPI001EE8C27E|nr:SDR family NAD(P)-dependent oxidoreductase [Amycolatopsis sp. Poz14]MCG3753945.1 SDR family oxidoreductase [Amycolatopsis sp. Poz14]